MGSALSGDISFLKIALTDLRCQNEENFLRWEEYSHQQIALLLNKNEALEMKLKELTVHSAITNAEEL